MPPHVPGFPRRREVPTYVAICVQLPDDHLRPTVLQRYADEVNADLADLAAKDRQPFGFASGVSRGDAPQQ